MVSVALDLSHTTLFLTKLLESLRIDLQSKSMLFNSSPILPHPIPITVHIHRIRLYNTLQYSTVLCYLEPKDPAEQLCPAHEVRVMIATLWIREEAVVVQSYVDLVSV